MLVLFSFVDLQIDLKYTYIKNQVNINYVRLCFMV